MNPDRRTFLRQAARWSEQLRVSHEQTWESTIVASAMLVQFMLEVRRWNPQTMGEHDAVNIRLLYRETQHLCLEHYMDRMQSESKLVAQWAALAFYPELQMLQSVIDWGLLQEVP